MNPHQIIRMVAAAALLAPAAAAVAQARLPAPQNVQVAGQESYSTPDDAMQAVIRASKSKDVAVIHRIFGPDAPRILSGDPAEDDKDLDDFSAAVRSSAQLRKDSDVRYTILIGKEKYPFPVPVVKDGSNWRFDTRAGAIESANRRIGENELSAITTTRAYAVAQWEYFTKGDWDNDAVAEYSQRLASTPGRHDGLFWRTGQGEPQSPLGEMLGARTPYHGYNFKILTQQSRSAPGGAYSYVINGNMIAGYALVAYPAEWGTSGVMTFIVNQQGRVYEKNLGPRSAQVAAAMTTYDPGAGWKLVTP